MRNLELRDNAERCDGTALQAGQSTAASRRPVVRSDQDATIRRAKRVGLFLMAVSTLVMIGLFGVIWLIARQLF